MNSALVSTTSYTDSSVVSGQTYYFVTTEVDSTGAESVYSNEAVAAIP
jgi:fibronectin type 3 domain-containing protein